MNKMLKTINGNEFKYRVENPDRVSVIAPGYLITPDGEFVDVKDEDSHSSVFSSYYRQYMELDTFKDYDVLKASQKLTEVGHVVYLGIKTFDPKVTGNESAGYCTLIMPDDISDITPEEKAAVLNLLSTNKSVFGNRKKVEVSIHTFSEEDIITEDELIDLYNYELRTMKKAV